VAQTRARRRKSTLEILIGCATVVEMDIT